MVRWKEHPEYDAFLRSFVPGHTETECIDAFRDEFGVELTTPQLANRKIKLGVKSGTHGGRFEPGNVPANKGRRRDEWMSEESQEICRRTQFAKGLMPHNTAPVGSERVTADGYIEVKVAERPRGRSAHDNWVPKARLVWEQANGRKVPDGRIVLFADGDPRNLDPGNLVLETRAQHGTITAKGIAYADAGTHATACAIADLTMAAGRARRRL